MPRLVLPLLSVATLLALPACSRSERPVTPTALQVDYDDTSVDVPGAIVVDFKDGTRESEFDEWERPWGVDLEFNSLVGKQSGVTVAVGVADVAAALARIRQNPAVESAEPLATYRSSYVPNDPEYGKQWNFQMIDMPKAWDGNRGEGVVVAVLDTGIAYEDHADFRRVPDLEGVRFADGYDFVNDDEHANDDHGHGTHVAGTIAQATNNAEGVAGVAFDATLMPVKVLDHFGSGNSADIADAIRWAADHGAKVVNMSLGGGGHSQVMASAVAYARGKGVTVVCAAGNGGTNRVEFPAAYPGAVAVSAVGPTGQLAPYSSYGKELDIAAPGGDKSQGAEGGVLQNTIDPRNPSESLYAWYQGTSMATPHVAGVAALLYAAGAESPDEVEKALYSGSRAAPGQSGWDERFGHGILNAAGSLTAFAHGSGASAPGDFASVQWSPLAWAGVLLALVLLTLKRRERPGYLNILVHPGFLLPLVLATVGFFFVRWWFGGSSDAVEAVSLPIPDWQRIIFGRGKLANPLFYSALLPLLVSFLGIKWHAARPVIAGLAMGFAGFLGYAAWAKAPALAWLPFTFLAIPWLVVNAAVCLVIARAMLRKTEAS